MRIYSAKPTKTRWSFKKIGSKVMVNKIVVKG